MERINQAGSESEAKLYVASGAIGGFDLMRAVRFGGRGDAEIHTTKMCIRDRRVFVPRK